MKRLLLLATVMSGYAVAGHAQSMALAAGPVNSGGVVTVTDGVTSVTPSVVLSFTSGCTLTKSGATAQVACTTGTNNPGSSTNAIQTNAGGGSFGGVSLTSGQVLVGQAGAPLAKAISGDASLAATGALTVTSSGGSLFGTAAFRNIGTSGGSVPLLNGSWTSSGAVTFSGVPKLTGLSTGTQVSCLGLDSTNAIVLLASACGAGSGGSGTVTSVALALPGIFTVSGSPVSNSGTLTGALATQSANLVFAGPGSGSAGAPTFRALVTTDLPATVAELNVAQSWTAPQRTNTETPTISVSTFTPGFATGQNHRIGLTAACPCTVANPAALVAGQSGVIEIVQDANGSRTIGSWGSAYQFSGGTSAIALSTAANAVDYVSYYVDSTGSCIVLGPILKGPAH